jgi:hypothetical protein
VVIFSASKDYEIGEVIQPVAMWVDEGHRVDPQPLVVLRKASLAEYMEQIPPEDQEWVLARRLSDGSRFYEVSTD